MVHAKLYWHRKPRKALGQWISSFGAWNRGRGGLTITIYIGTLMPNGKYKYRNFVLFKLLFQDTITLEHMKLGRVYYTPIQQATTEVKIATKYNPVFNMNIKPQKSKYLPTYRFLRPASEVKLWSMDFMKPTDKIWEEHDCYDMTYQRTKLVETRCCKRVGTYTDLSLGVLTSPIGPFSNYQLPDQL